MSIIVSGASFAWPGDLELFANVSFHVDRREHAALLGENGSGKSTLMKILAGQLAVQDGEARVAGTVLYLPQDIGFASTRTVREMLLHFASPHQRDAGLRLFAAERRMAEDDASDDAGCELGFAIAQWAEVGGYELEGKWDASVRRILGTDLSALDTRTLGQLSGGELKRLAIDVLFSSDAEVLLLDEPDNYLDVPSKAWLEELVRTSKKTLLSISHDREYLRNTANKIVTLEGFHTWVHGGPWATYPEAGEQRQASLKDTLARWNEEERRLFQYMKLMKQRASVSPKNAPRAKAAETRWKRFTEPGPPPPPVTIRQVRVRLQGGDSARRMLVLADLSLNGSIRPFSAVVHHGERIGLVGSNGTGKSHLLQLLSGERLPSGGTVTIGSRVSAGRFTQVNDRPDFIGVAVVDIVQQRVGNHERAMQLLGRYGLERAARQPYETLSGGQKARLEVLVLEVEGHNLLLLDEPTDNLDIGSSEALESALERFDGTCVSVSHDRSFLRTQDRWWMVEEDGAVFDILAWDDALASLMCGRATGNARPMTRASSERNSKPLARAARS